MQIIYKFGFKMVRIHRMNIFLQFIFETTALSLGDLFFITLVASSVFVVDEFWKFYFRTM